MVTIYFIFIYYWLAKNETVNPQTIAEAFHYVTAQESKNHKKD